VTVCVIGALPMSAYLGRSGLEQLREGLAERDLLVLRSVNEHRFLTTAQIKALHFVNGTEAGAERSCRRTLTRLSRDRVLNRLQRRVGGVRAGSASFVYTVGPIGRRLLGNARRTTEPSSQFLDHTLAIADVRVRLEHAARARCIELLKVEIEPMSWRRFVGPGGARDIVKPDLYVVTGTGAYEDAWFIEVDRGTESIPTLIGKCRQYDRYRRTGLEQAAHDVFPRVIWVMPTDRHLERLQDALAADRHIDTDLFRLTRMTDVAQVIAGAAP
jgi:hypothetical protein